MGHPQVRWFGVADDPTWGNHCPIARRWEDVEALPLNWVECANFWTVDNRWNQLLSGQQHCIVCAAFCDKMSSTTILREDYGRGGQRDGPL